MNSHAKIKTESARVEPAFKELLKRVRSDFPDISFKSAEAFSWSAEDSVIFYDTKAERPAWSLLHELGHMEHGHNNYNTDAALVRMEVEAWEAAKLFATRYGLVIDEEHIQDCIDSYRDWRHGRSTCPVCLQTGIEKERGLYNCFNCRNTWRVTNNRFCRVYRSMRR